MVFLMRFWSGGGSELMAKKEFSRSLWCKNVILLKHRDRPHGQKEPPWGHEEWLLRYYEVGKLKSKGGLHRDLDMLKRTPKRPEALLLSS